jgi:antitoxin component HigA of HigAB toxin-antitoxin module
MEILDTKEEYEKALEEIQHLLDAAPNTAEAEKLEILIEMVQEYEQKVFALV